MTCDTGFKIAMDNDAFVIPLLNAVLPHEIAKIVDRKLQSRSTPTTPTATEMVDEGRRRAESAEILTHQVHDKESLRYSRYEKNIRYDFVCETNTLLTIF